MAKAKIGVIGGSGLYSMPGLEKAREVRVATPFGKPSDVYMVGTLDGRPVAFLARHGRGHVISPSELNFRANIYGFKKLGVERIISVSAVGSLREDFHPTDMALPTQFVDRTRQRISTFFEGGLVAHIGFDTPVCPTVVDTLAQACAGVGPAFSTKAESNLYRSWGMDIIGMTSLQEAKLAREAEICYAVLSMVTDYDCWHPHHDAVSITQVLDYLARNVENSRKIVRHAVRALPEARNCPCASALAHAILTDRKRIPPATRKKLTLLVGKYLK